MITREQNTVRTTYQRLKPSAWENETLEVFDRAWGGMFLVQMCICGELNMAKSPDNWPHLKARQAEELCFFQLDRISVIK